MTYGSGRGNWGTVETIHRKQKMPTSDRRLFVWGLRLREEQESLLADGSFGVLKIPRLRPSIEYMEFNESSSRPPL